MKERYYKLVTDFDISEEDYIENIEIFISLNSPFLLDKGYLSPPHFKKFCGMFRIPYSKLADEYYDFTLRDYAHIIYNQRNFLEISQKKLAQLTHISPVDIYKFESYIRYPTREQYEKLKVAIRI